MPSFTFKCSGSVKHTDQRLCNFGCVLSKARIRVDEIEEVVKVFVDVVVVLPQIPKCTVEPCA